jgi:hypothetical protein
MCSIIEEHEKEIKLRNYSKLKLHATISKIADLAKKWRIKINRNKSTHITFTLRNQTCPTVQMSSVDLPHKNEVKYQGMHLDRRLTWATDIKTERKQLNLNAK